MEHDASGVLASVKVGRQDKRVTPTPVHHCNGLRLPGVCDGSVLVWKVPVQIIVAAVVPPQVPTDVSCREMVREEKSKMSGNVLLP